MPLFSRDPNIILDLATFKSSKRQLNSLNVLRKNLSDRHVFKLLLKIIRKALNFSICFQCDFYDLSAVSRDLAVIMALELLMSMSDGNNNKQSGRPYSRLPIETNKKLIMFLNSEPQ